MPLEFKSYDHFVRQTNFPDFYWRHQRHGYGIWNFLSCPFSLPSFIFMAFLKPALEGRRQYDATWKKQGTIRDGLKWIQEDFFRCCHSLHATSTIPSQQKSPILITPPWELNSYGIFNFLQPLTFFNLTNQIHNWLRKIWHQIFFINSMINQASV